METDVSLIFIYQIFIEYFIEHKIVPLKKGLMYNVGDRYMNKLLQTYINSSLYTVLRCTEEGTLSVKAGCVMGMVHPGRSNLRRV